MPVTKPNKRSRFDQLKSFHHFQRLFCSCAIVSLVLSATPLPASDIQAVFPNFENALKLPPAQNPSQNNSTSATFFGGHVKESRPSGANTDIPASSILRLPESAFGQIADFQVRYPDVNGVALRFAECALYYDAADQNEECQTYEFYRNDAAFRYKVYLYQRTEEGVAPNYEALQDLWSDVERERAEDAGYALAAALQYSPRDVGLRNALLDVLYDKAIAERTLAKEAEVEAIKAAMGFTLADPGGSFAISNEIELLEQALDYYLNASKPYYILFSDRMGVGTLVAGGAVSETAFGYLMFREQQPSRSLSAPNFLDGTPVVDDDGTEGADQIFAGYKDLVLLFDIQRDTARLSAKLVKLHALRGDAGDFEEAKRLLGEALQRGYTDGAILEGMFTDGELAEISETSGLNEARAGWRQSLTELSGTKAFLDGEANPLGLDPAFLGLIQTKEGDTYKFFENFLLGPASPLNNAIQKYNTAKSNYETFRVYQDRIEDELGAHRRQFADRLRSITGCIYPLPSDPESCFGTEGSEIGLQLQSIELASNRILRNDQEIANLNSQIEIEIERVGVERGVNDLIADTYVRYGEKQAKLTREIADVSARQAFYNEVAAAYSSIGINPLSAVAGFTSHAANAVAQGWAEQTKGGLNAKKEQYSAKQSAEITYLQGAIIDANSQALVKNLLLQMSVLEIESAEAALVLAQEVGRLQGLVDEKNYLEVEFAAARLDLSTRYFADPSHRIVQSRDILIADRAFQEAQFWVFVLARALDYRWNRNVVADGYSAGTVFKLRNAQELQHMAQALFSYDAAQQIGNRHGNTFVKFSVREDFLGYRRIGPDGNNAIYPDPQTGEPVDALAAFRSYLKYEAPHEVPDWGTYSEVLRLKFSTAKPNLQGTFFSPDRYNEKINYLQLKIVAESAFPDLAARLTQSGTAFIRNQLRGRVVDPDRPDLVVGEMTSYPVRQWYQIADPATGETYFRSKDRFEITVNAVVVPDPDAPPESYKAEEFHELSPAVSDWVLEIPIAHSSGIPILDLDRINDIEIWFYNYYFDRPE